MKKKGFGYITHIPNYPITVHVQKQRMMKYATIKGINIIKFYIETSIGTKNSELKRLFIDVKQENADVLLIHSLKQIAPINVERMVLLNSVLQLVKEVEIIERSTFFKLIAAKLLQK
jgi:hypothetical protein